MESQLPKPPKYVKFKKSRLRRFLLNMPVCVIVGIDRKGKVSKDRHSVVTQSRREAEHLAEVGLVSVEVTKTLTEQ